MRTRALATLGLIAAATAWAEPGPALRDGDIVLQTSRSKQSYAIMWASKSVYSHVGLVEIGEDGKPYVLEAIARVSRTPLSSWIARGRLGRYTVARPKMEHAAAAAGAVAAAKRYLGRKYDIHFAPGDREIYCSELISLAYREAGLEVGRWQPVRELDVDNPVARALFKKRWKGHPSCRGKARGFDACWKAVLDDKLVTPASLVEDGKVEVVYSNYP